ncbi:MAG: hypothetical protein Q7R96_01930 [Nanoarchaeota archaeon]|nr:hypothetical protein [Nanoarchaeota archaeon]
MPSVDDYIQTVIQQGDEGSRLLANITAPTLKNNAYVDVVQSGMNGVAVLRIPENYAVVVHSASGHPEKTNIKEHTASLIRRLLEQAQNIGATPIGFADVIDSRTGDLSLLTDIATTLAVETTRHNVAILNGENAILGERVTEANVSGTMISMIPKKHIFAKDGSYEVLGTPYIRFDPQGQPVYINSDGVGTKTAFYEILGNYIEALRDSLAMKWDDTIKLAARVRATSDVLEYNGAITLEEIRALFEPAVTALAKEFSLPYILNYEHVGKRIQGRGYPSYHISGSVVSTIDEEQLKHPPRPTPEEQLIAIRGKPNPRSNGITAKRKALARCLGEQWYDSAIGETFLEYLATPSTIFYPLFKTLLENKEASSFYHMSGGAYKGKLAKPLAHAGCYVEIENLFPPDWRELALAGFNLYSAEQSFAQWPMGNEGFITTSTPDAALKRIITHGLEGKVVGTLEASDGEDRKGIQIRAFNGALITFKG